MNKIPKNWSIESIGSVGEKFVGGGTPSREIKEYYNGNIPWLTVKDINEKDFYKSTAEEKITLRAIEESSSNLIEAGNIIISTRMALGRGVINICPMAINQDMRAIYLNRTKISNEYFLQWFKGNSEKVEALGSGSTVKGITLDLLKNIELPLPPVHEQKKIAEILSTVDRVIELTEIEIEKLKNLKKGMMQDLLTKGIGHTKFKDSPIGKIPESWDCLTIKEVVEFVTYGFTNPMPTTDTGPFMVTATNINDGRITYENCRKTSLEDFESKLSEKSKPKIHDVLLTKDGSLGRVAIVDKEGICINQSVALIRLKDSDSSLFLKHLLESPYYQDVMINNAGGSTIKHIYITTLDKMYIAWPSKFERTQISNIINTIGCRLNVSLEKLEKVKNVKKGLMQDLLTGKVRVKV